MHTVDKIIFRNATPEIAVTESQAGVDEAVRATRRRGGHRDGAAGGS